MEVLRETEELMQIGDLIGKVIENAKLTISELSKFLPYTTKKTTLPERKRMAVIRGEIQNEIQWALGKDEVNPFTSLRAACLLCGRDYHSEVSEVLPDIIIAASMNGMMDCVDKLLEYNERENMPVCTECGYQGNDEADMAQHSCEVNNCIYCGKEVRGRDICDSCMIALEIEHEEFKRDK